MYMHMYMYMYMYMFVCICICICMCICIQKRETHERQEIEDLQQSGHSRVFCKCT